MAAIRGPRRTSAEPWIRVSFGMARRSKRGDAQTMGKERIPLDSRAATEPRGRQRQCKCVRKTLMEPLKQAPGQTLARSRGAILERTSASMAAGNNGTKNKGFTAAKMA